jgi:hypothetical protein
MVSYYSFGERCMSYYCFASCLRTYVKCTCHQVNHQVWTAELNMDVEVHSSDEEDVGHLVWGSSSLLS